MAIDQQIQEKVDAYRNNPEALQKNYQMNQDLLDLLALQKIKSEKDAAARELQMSMKQDPQTIAGQRMAEEGKRTKDELVKQVGGVAGQIEQQKQRNLQRAAAGVASQPAPNMRMAGGGIVSFAPGGDVTSEKIEEAERKFSRGTGENIVDIIRTILIGSQTGDFGRAADRVFGERKLGKVPPGVDVGIGGPDTPLPSAPSFQAGDVEAAEFSLAGQGAPLPTEPKVRQISKQSNSGLTLATPTLLQTDKEESVADILKEAAAARKDRMETVSKNLNRSGVAKIRAEQLAQQKALSEKNAANRKENRFYDLLARAGGEGAFANIGRAGSDLRQGDRMQSQLDLDKFFERQDKKIADDITIGKAEIQSGDNYEKIVSTASTAELDRISNQKIANLDAKTKVRVANFKALIQQRTDALKAEADRATNITNLTKALSDLEKMRLEGKLKIEQTARERLTELSLASPFDADEIEEAFTRIKQDVGLTIAPELKSIDNEIEKIKMRMSGFSSARLKSS